MGKIKVTQTRSAIKRPVDQKKTLVAMGIKKLHQTFTVFHNISFSKRYIPVNYFLVLLIAVLTKVRVGRGENLLVAFQAVSFFANNVKPAPFFQFNRPALTGYFLDR